MFCPIDLLMYINVRKSSKSRSLSVFEDLEKLDAVIRSEILVLADACVCVDTTMISLRPFSHMAMGQKRVPKNNTW